MQKRSLTFLYSKEDSELYPTVISKLYLQYCFGIPFILSLPLPLTICYFRFVNYIIMTITQLSPVLYIVKIFETLKKI